MIVDANGDSTMCGASCVAGASPALLRHVNTHVRTRRVLILIIGIVLLSLADLALTLTHLRSVGMIESNPIAAHIIRATNSTLALSAYKFVTVGFCVAVLFYVRRQRIGEGAAWLSLIICAGMCVTWHRYATYMDDLEALMLAQGTACEHWLMLD